MYKIKQIGIISAQDSENLDLMKEIAYELGRVFKEYCLSAIIIGKNVLNSIIAESIKKKGSHVLGVQFENNEISETFYYDFIVTVENPMKNSLDQIINSCGGIIIIGNPNNIDIKLSSLIDNIISINIANINKDTYKYKSKSIPIFKSAENGITYLLKNNSQISLINNDYFNKGIKCRYESYPIGEKGQYLQSADLFLASAYKYFFHNNNSKWKISIANYYNSLGDNCYYHENDFFKAASYYSQALKCLINKVDSKDDYVREMIYYLISIITECVAFSFDRRICDQDLAIYVGKKAITRYKYAIQFSNEDTNKCYKHTISGLKGWIEYLYAKLAINNRNHLKAMNHIAKTIKYYEKSLSFIPQWKTSGFSDNISVSESEISKLLMDIGIIKSKVLDLESLKLLIENNLNGEKDD